MKGGGNRDEGRLGSHEKNIIMINTMLQFCSAVCRVAVGWSFDSLVTRAQAQGIKSHSEASSRPLWSPVLCRISTS